MSNLATYYNYFEAIATAHASITHGTGGDAYALEGLEAALSLQRASQGAKPTHLIALLPTFTIDEESDAEQPFWRCRGGFIVAKRVDIRGNSPVTMLAGMDDCHGIAVSIINTMVEDSRDGTGPYADTITGIADMDASITHIPAASDGSAVGVMVIFNAAMRQTLDCE